MYFLAYHMHVVEMARANNIRVDLKIAGGHYERCTILGCMGDLVLGVATLPFRTIFSKSLPMLSMNRCIIKSLRGATCFRKKTVRGIH